ncbi:CENP-S associating centromere protein X-domain-containing protein [Aspergillus pseudodeflectus]|uniref:CENP-S associating centromere protein X-domain-containing protein n=1 Tax=Aspergillus pseudodeflectus TaxID=176178 RepID=A0ABR4L3N7_9EURO
MPPERRPAQKRRHLPFKPPSRASSTTAGASKPSSSTKPTTTKPTKPTTTGASSKPKTSASSSKTTANRRKVNPSPPSDASDDAATSSDSDSEHRNFDHETNSADEADYILAEITHHKDPDTEEVISSEPLIPQKLLTKLLHHHFRKEKTKIAKDANAVVAKYIDVFVREAVARAAYERSESGTGGGIGDGFLEVEDLEKMGPQLAMDF